MERVQLELWKAPVAGDAEANGRAAKLVLDARWAPFWTQVSRDGRTILFNSKAKGSWNLYTMPSDASAPPRQVTFFSGNVVMHASLSPDGTRVAYASQQDGLSEIWVAGVDGSGARKISSDGGPDYWPIWSRDGRSVVYSTPDKASRLFRAWRVPADGGAAEPLPGGDTALRGDASPVDDRYVFWIDDTIKVLDGTGRETLKLQSVPAMRWSLPVFSPDGRSFTALKAERSGSKAVWLYDAATGAGRPLVRFPGAFDLVFRAGWADGGNSVVVNRQDTPSNVVLVEGF
jgi:Tol biopolymer transport system component